MARKNDPYIPLYAQDWLTNLKLKECSPASHGLMISVMCLMHKSDDYGKLLLREKHKICRGKSDGKVLDFAAYLSKILPWTVEQIQPSLIELLEENVLFFDGDFLVCGRMVRDGELSETRSKSGKKGADVTNGATEKKDKPSKKGKKSNENFAAANQSANTEIEIDNENRINSSDSNGLIPISNRGMQGGKEIAPEFFQALYFRFVSAYGNLSGRPHKRDPILIELTRAIRDYLDSGVCSNEMEAATHLCNAASMQKEAYTKMIQQGAKSSTVLNAENWLSEKCYYSNMTPETVEVLTPAQKRQKHDDEMLRKVFDKMQKDKEAQNAAR